VDITVKNTVSTLWRVLVQKITKLYLSAFLMSDHMYMW